MNKLATFITASLLGLTSVASADPSIEVSGSASVHGSVTAHVTLGNGTGAGAVIIRDHRAPTTAPINRDVMRYRRRYVKPVRPTPRPRPPIVVQPPAPPVIILPSPWIEIGTVATGKQSLSHKLWDGKRFDSLMLQVSGSVDLNQVLIVFEDGQEQKVKFDDAGANRRFIDLAGADREISHVIVYSDGNRGDIKVLARNDFNRTMPEPLSRWHKLGTVATGKQRLGLEGSRTYDLLALTVSGSVHLNKILINYANGDSQVVAYDETLTSQSRTPIIDLAGDDRDISGILVYTDAAAHGELTLYAL